MTRSVLCALAVCLLVAVLPGTAVAEKTLSLTATSFDFNVAAGQQVSGTLSVINDGDEPMNVLIYAMNQVVDDSGKVDYKAPAMTGPASERGAAAWVTVKVPADARMVGNVPYVETRPGDTFPVEFSVKVPADAPPGDHQIVLFFEIGDDSQPSGQSTAKVSGRLGARVSLRVQGDIVERISVEPFVVRQFVIGRLLPYTFRVNNGGNVDKTVTATLDLMDSSDRATMTSVPVSHTVVYAGSSLEFSDVVTTSVAPGRYTLRLTTDYSRETSGADSGVSEQIVKERAVWIIPLWLAVVPVLVIGGLLLWLSWRRALVVAQRKQRATRRQTQHTRTGGADADYRETTTE
ncbi:MAG: hypothetical protein WBI63_04815 [Coriobacteriia bacterium]